MCLLDCSLTGLIPTADWYHDWIYRLLPVLTYLLPIFSQLLLSVQNMTKKRGKKIQEYFFLKSSVACRVSSLPSFNQIFLPFRHPMQKESSDYSGPWKNYPEWYMKIRYTYMRIRLSQRVFNSRASEKSAEKVRSPLMSETGQVASSCRQLEIGLWDYNFFIHLHFLQ